MSVLAAYTGGGALATTGQLHWTYVAMFVVSVSGMLFALLGRRTISGLHAMAACAIFPLVGLWTPSAHSSALSEVLWMVVVPGLGSVIVPLRSFVPSSLLFLGLVLWLLWSNPDIPPAAAFEVGLGVSLVSVLGTIAAWKLDRKRRGLLAEVEERRERERRLEVYSTELELLSAIGRRLVSNPALPGALSALCQEIRQRLDLALVSIYLCQEDGGLRYLASDGYDIPSDLVLQPSRESALVSCVREGRPIYEPDVGRAAHYLAGSADVSSELVVPLQVGSRLLGALNLESKQVDGFSESMRDLLQRVGHLFAVALDREEMFDALVSARDSLVRANLELEDRVDKRTAELVQEVSERRATEEQLLAANRELEGMHQRLVQLSKLAAVGELGAGIAHELNQPLAAIELFAESLRKEPDRRVGERMRELSIIQEQGRRMAQLVDNLRAFSRRSSIRLQRLAASSPLDDALTLLQQPLSLASVEVERHFAPDLPDVHGDPVLLQQLFVNLLTNSLQALDSSPPGRPRTIRVSAEAAEPGVQYTFEDSGPGIPAELESRIFEPFFTTREEHGGTGLGLPLSARIAQRHGGELIHVGGATSGACFRLSLPRWQTQAEAPPSPIRQPAEEQSGHILAVDDEQVVLFGLQRLVKAWGWELTSATSAARALEAVEKGGTFDVALVDLRMPGVSGLELIEQLRRLAPTMQILVMSGYLSEENRQALEALGVSRVLPKPVPSEHLREALSSALSGRAAPAPETGSGELTRSWLHADTPAEGWGRFLGEPEED